MASFVLDADDFDGCVVFAGDGIWHSDSNAFLVTSRIHPTILIARRAYNVNPNRPRSDFGDEFPKPIVAVRLNKERIE